MVYVWKRGDRYLYVGKCYHGFSRVVNYNKHEILKKDRIEDTDVIKITYFDSEEECLEFEKFTIKLYNPEWNFKPGRRKAGDKDKASTLFLAGIE